MYNETGDLILGKIVLNEIAMEIWHSGDIRKGRALIEENLKAMRQFRAGLAIIFSLSALINMCAFTGDYESALKYAEESLYVKHRYSRIEEGYGFYDRGMVEFLQDHLDAARQSFENGLKMSRAEQYTPGRINALIYLGMLDVFEGRIEQGLAMMEDGKALYHTLPEGNAVLLNNYYYFQGLTACRRQDFTHAQACLREYMRRTWNNGDAPGVPEILEALAAAELGLKEYRRGASLLGAAQRQREAMGAPVHPVYQADYERTLLGLKTALPEVEFQQAWADGAAFSVAESVDYALADGISVDSPKN